MQESTDISHKRSLRPDYSILLTSLLFSAALPLTSKLFLALYLNTWHWPHESLHALLESLGSFAAITLALFILIMRRNRKLSPKYLWVASSLMGMGVLDLFHASTSSGNIFTWLHTLATMLGGLTLALILLPEHLASHSSSRCLPCATWGSSIFIGTFSFFFPEYLPVMLKKKEFSLLANSMNAVGGLGFILAWLHFCLRDVEEQFYNEKKMLANFSLLFAVAALLFDFSILWGPTWWLMHVVRLVAYLALLQFFLKIYSRDIGYIRQNQIELKQRTSQLERTQRHLSDIIEYSPTAITLKDIKGRFIVVNRKFSDLFASSKDRLIDKTAADLFSPNAAVQQQDEENKVIQQGQPTENEEEYLDVNEQKRTFIVDRFPLRDADNKIYGVGSVMTDISDRMQAETERKQLLIENTERLKELHCLYGLSRLAEHTDSSDYSLTSMLKKITGLILVAWQYTEAAGARIIIDKNQILSKNFKKTKWLQESPVFINGEKRGAVQVYYNRSFPYAHEGPFLQEERDLLNEIALRLGNIIQQKNAEKELRKSFEFNKKIIEEFPVGLSVYNSKGQCIASNSYMKKIIGFSKKQQLCISYNEIDYWQETGLCAAAQQSIAEHTNVSHNFNIEDTRGKKNFFTGIFVPFMLHDEQRLLLMVENVTKQKKAEEELKSTLLEKESLLKEIHHRVKNNMQIVASLMFLQAQDINNEEVKKILQESQDRVKSMSLVHELLYQSGNLAKVPFQEYIENLVSSLRQSYNAYNVLFQTETEPLDLPINTAIPCGLILNELITNSIKHAFTGGETNRHAAKLTISFHKKETFCVLSVSDNGAGLPPEYDWNTSNTLGLNLIRTLSNQLDAEMKFENQNGTTCWLRFNVTS
ncbi:PAS domain S-box protein [Desulfobulbus sp. TB]|nr:PAS domain S-box protein [Desulfobulbus sp. TB]